MITTPFLTTYDPPGSSEGTLDPLGLYTIADGLAQQLVPAVRERMLRIRFLTPMTVGALLTEDLPHENYPPGIYPHLVWEWLVVEAIVRTQKNEGQLWGLPGVYVVGSAVDDYGYVDTRSYLKTPRVFGFHGVYKRLAVQLGLVDSGIRFRAPKGEALVRAWSRDRGLKNFNPQHPLFQKWQRAIKRSLESDPVRTRPPAGWKKTDWQELAEAFLPHGIKKNERDCISRMLLADDHEQLGALPFIWHQCDVLHAAEDEEIDERAFHGDLKQAKPDYEVLINAIGSYELFCRNLNDGFDILRSEGTQQDVRGLQVTELAKDAEFQQIAAQSHTLYQQALLDVGSIDAISEAKLIDRFALFAEPMPVEQFAIVLCEHHENIQKEKSRDGKRPWFDRLGTDRIYVRRNYRVERPERNPVAYVNSYRTYPVYRFFSDLK